MSTFCQAPRLVLELVSPLCLFVPFPMTRKSKDHSTLACAYLCLLKWWQWSWEPHPCSHPLLGQVTLLKGDYKCHLVQGSLICSRWVLGAGYDRSLSRLPWEIWLRKCSRPRDLLRRQIYFLGVLWAVNNKVLRAFMLCSHWEEVERPKVIQGVMAVFAGLLLKL